jgi:HEAT repeat protein
MSQRAPGQLAAQLSGLSRPEDQAERERLILQALADPSAREVAVAWAAHTLEPSLLVPLVANHADSVLRNAALAALERQGPYALECVERMTCDADIDVAMFACQVLGAIGGFQSSGPLLAALERPEINVKQAAIEALGRLRAKAAIPALVGLLERDPWLQLAAVGALGEIGSPKAVDALLKLVPDSFVAEPALDALGRIGSPKVLPVLLPHFLDLAHVRLKPALLRAMAPALAESAPTPAIVAAGRTIERDHAVGSLWHFLSEELGGAGQEADLAASVAAGRDDRSEGRGGGPSVRNAATMVVGAGVSSLLPLVLRWAADKNGVQWIQRLAARFSSEQLATAVLLLGHPDPAVRAGVLRALAPDRMPVDVILSRLEDPDPDVQLAAMAALGALQEPRAAKLLAERLLASASHPENSADGSAKAADAAAHALARLPSAAVEAVLGPLLAPDKGPASWTAALSVLGLIHIEGLEDRVLQLAGTAAAADPSRRPALRAAARIPGTKSEVLLLRALADRDAAIQVEALDLLVARGGERVVVTMLALLNIADSLRYHVIRALGRLRTPRAAAPLETLFPAAPLHEQLEILTALARIGADSTRPFLSECLTHPQGEIRRTAARAMADLAAPEDLDLFVNLAADTDWVLRSEAARALGHIRMAEGRPVLLDLVRDLEPAVARTARAALAGVT